MAVQNPRFAEIELDWDNKRRGASRPSYSSEPSFAEVLDECLKGDFDTALALASRANMGLAIEKIIRKHRGY